MKGKIGDVARLNHIFDCINEIEAAIKGHTFETFYENHVLRIAIVKWLEIIGEASRHFSEETKDKYRDIDWRKIIDLRNFVVHEYFEIGYEFIWDSATIYLKDLKTQLEVINLDLN
jgi:uncharacterized protein with HEPN domain